MLGMPVRLLVSTIRRVLGFIHKDIYWAGWMVQYCHQEPGISHHLSLPCSESLWIVSCSQDGCRTPCIAAFHEYPRRRGGGGSKNISFPFLSTEVRIFSPEAFKEFILHLPDRGWVIDLTLNSLQVLEVGLDQCSQLHYCYLNKIKVLLARKRGRMIVGWTIYSVCMLKMLKTKLKMFPYYGTLYHSGTLYLWEITY